MIAKPTSTVREASSRRWLHGALPLVLLVVLLVTCWAVRTAAGEMRPRLESDTESYLKAPLDAGPALVLSYHRTQGYPWFLRFGRRLGPGFTPIPHLQALLYSLGVLVFYAGVRRFSRRPWIALLAAIPLSFAPVTSFTASLLSETPAAALVLASAGLTLLASVRTGSNWVWLALALMVFVANQVRPTTQWLVVWVPIAVLLLSWLGFGRVLWRRVVAAVVATSVPWLMFAVLRLAVVGHFGLVSFAGTNLAAIGTFLVDSESITAMPKDVRPTARLILKRREQNGWPRLEAGDDARQWFGRYNRSLWKVAYRSANWHMHRELRSAEGAEVDLWQRSFPVERDRRLGVFAAASVRGNSGGYLAWVVGAVRFGLAQALRSPPVTASLLALTIAAGWRLVRRALRRPAHLSWPSSGTLGAIFLLHCFGALVLTSTFSFPNQRYLAEITLLLPSGLLLLTVWVAPLSSHRPETVTRPEPAPDADRAPRHVL